MQRPSADIDGFDAAWRGGADCGVIAFADREIVLHDPSERRERQRHLGERLIFGAADVEDQPVLLDAEMQMIGTARSIRRDEAVILQEIENSDGALMLHVGAAAHHGALIQRNLQDAVALASHATLSLARSWSQYLAVAGAEPEPDRKGVGVEPFGAGQAFRRGPDGG